ncbi:MAG: hypothetical protein JSV22_13015 [Bacteroidales bacterium]|nr:MAG: hypothetical protein JSV22_13015 [Bacteroidales bacterium]
MSQPKLSISNDNLTITYDILGAKADEKFNIWLEVTDDKGVKINAAALSGDIGDSVVAGSNKRIVWNLNADNIFIDNTINVEIIAEKIKPEVVMEDSKVTEEPAPALTRVKVGNHILQSAVFPGWGLTTLTKGKPYWLMGVAGIGCIASSIYYNQKAHSSYDTYLTSSDDDIVDYWQDAVDQGDISKVFAYSAAAIWVVNLGIVTIKATSMNKAYKRSRLNAISVSPRIDSSTYTPMLSLNYKF